MGVLRNFIFDPSILSVRPNFRKPQGKCREIAGLASGTGILIREPHHLAWLEANPHRSAEWLKDRLRDGFHVHHIDCDHGNNDPENLLLLDGVDHMRLHALPIGQELKKLARLRMMVSNPEPRDTLIWRVGCVAYILRRNGWCGHAISLFLYRVSGEGYRRVTVVGPMKSFAKEERLEWPIRTATCSPCSKRLAGRSERYPAALEFDQRLFPNGVPHHRSMLLPICDWLAEFGEHSANCTRGLNAMGKPKYGLQHRSA